MRPSCAGYGTCSAMGGFSSWAFAPARPKNLLFAHEGHTTLYPFNVNHFLAVHAAIGNRPVYLSVDLDVLDPSVFPGTGTPEPGGCDFVSIMQFLVAAAQFKLVGADLVELAPHYDPSGVSTAVALKLLRELLIAYQKHHHA